MALNEAMKTHKSFAILTIPKTKMKSLSRIERGLLFTIATEVTGKPEVSRSFNHPENENEVRGLLFTIATGVTGKPEVSRSFNHPEKENEVRGLLFTIATEVTGKPEVSRSFNHP